MTVRRQVNGYRICLWKTGKDKGNTKTKATVVLYRYLSTEIVKITVSLYFVGLKPFTPMNLERYEYTVDRLLLDYEFFSEGPNGKIRKFISFSPCNMGGKTFFSLSLGDYIEHREIVDYLSVSNNKDTEKILATIAAAVLEFTNTFPDMGVYAIGSTPARTRLYQMNIRKYWNDIDPLLFVYGYTNCMWEIFEKNVNYEAFFVRKKG